MFLGIDVGTSSIKACLLDAESGRHVASAVSPEFELPILAPQPGFAEQDPEVWWEHTVRAVQMLPAEGRSAVRGVGIGYQMHGLVLVDAEVGPTRNAIIWCDGRAAPIGAQAFAELGDYCLAHLLNSPGNFTAAKLRWVIENEPATVDKSRWAMLPGDFIALRITGEALTTNSGLSEMAAWDFTEQAQARKLLDYFEIDARLLPDEVPTFCEQGTVQPNVAALLGIPPSARVTFRAGDQPTNALALNVLNPGETAATAGTSGVIYSVIGEPWADSTQRVNTFLHVNRSSQSAPFGVLCCVNGCGSLMSWLRNVVLEGRHSYQEMDAMGAAVAPDSDGALVYPFGNGVERILGNVSLGAHVCGVDFGRHGLGHLMRAVQEGIAFAMFYGVEALPRPDVIRASNANLFLSPVFAQTVADLTGARVEIHDTQGVFGAAWGAAIGAGAVERPSSASVVRSYSPSKGEKLTTAYARWKSGLARLLEQEGWLPQ